MSDDLGHPGRRPAVVIARRARWVALVVAMLCVVPAAASADVGYRDFSYTGTGTPTGTKRAESVLWFNDGTWWGNMWSSAKADFHIFRLDTTTQQWIDTGVLTDRPAGW
jgi:hypothetical protein